MKIRWFVLVGVFALVFPLSAQDDAVATVTTAFENLAEQSSYSFELEQVVDQTVSAAGVEADTSITQTGGGVARLNDDVIETASTLEQVIETDLSGQNVELTQTIEFIQVDDEAFIQISTDDAALAGVYPEGWVNLTDDPNAIPGFNAEALSQLSSPTAQYPINEDTITEIEEIGTDEISGEEARIFAVELDTAAVFSDENTTALTSLLGSDIESLGVDVEELLNQFAENSELTFEIAVGTDSELPLQVVTTLTSDLELEIQNQDIRIEQTVVGTIVFSEFGEEVEIEAPDVE